MAAQQEFCETSDRPSIRLVEIMNAMGYSMCERNIHRHYERPRNTLLNIFNDERKYTFKIAGSTGEGMRGGFHCNKQLGDEDIIITDTTIKLYPTPAYNTNYSPSYFVEEDVDFPGYVKLSSNINDNKKYVSNSVKLNLTGLTIPSKSSIPNDFDRLLDTYQMMDINGPAHTLHHKGRTGITETMDFVPCIQYDMWPDSAKSFVNRCRRNNWPSNNLLENIKSQGCDVVPVGHPDSQNKDIQWRISFPGERNLLLNLTDVQTLCYALIKIILKENLNTSQREVVSSFHIRHVIFWCVERCSCEWEYPNYINCLNICLTKLIEMIKDRRIPHFIIESRNLFNSKMTPKMSKEIVDVLDKYNTNRVYEFDGVKCVLELVRYNYALLKVVTLRSTIIAGFNCCFSSFSSFVRRPSSFWTLYLPHNATESLLNYKNVLKHLNKEKGAAIHYVKYVVRSMVGFLYYAKYKESNNSEFLVASKRLIQKSLDLDNSCIQLRAATFLIYLDYSQSMEICDTFLTFPPRYKIDSSFLEYNKDMLTTVVFQRLFTDITTERIENIKTIVPLFFRSVKLKFLHGNYDIKEHNPDWIFRNLTNIYFHGLYMDVSFMTAEKWVVPDPIQYELLSLPKHVDGGLLSYSGIYLDPMFVCLQTQFLCYHSKGNTNDMDAILNKMNIFITENTFTTHSSCAYLNMFTYCQIKAGNHRQSVKSILQSLRTFSSRYNTASGYLKIVLQILNSLPI